MTTHDEMTNAEFLNLCNEGIELSHSIVAAVIDGKVDAMKGMALANRAGFVAAKGHDAEKELALIRQAFEKARTAYALRRAASPPVASGSQHT